MTNNKKHIVRYYLNPETGRVIKSHTKKFQELMSTRGYKRKPTKHSCFYNIKSAEKCLNKLLTLYPGIIHPPSSFAKIPRTYHKGPYRGFIMDTNEEKVIGTVDKHGKMNRLQTPIVPSHRVPIVKDPFGVTASVILQKPALTQDEQTKVQEQLETGKPLSPPEQINLIYNPVFDDIIPVNEQLDHATQVNIVEKVNENLVPLHLPPITPDSNIAGLVKSGDEIIGVVDTDNQIKRFPEPVPTQTQSETIDTESQDTGTQTDTQSEGIETIETQSQDTDTQTDTQSEGVDTESQDTQSQTDADTKIKIEGIPTLELDTTQVATAETLSPRETAHVIETINCLDGEQYDTNSKRCLPCSHYNLEWDSEAKMCKVKAWVTTNNPVVMIAGQDSPVGYL